MRTQSLQEQSLCGKQEKGWMGFQIKIYKFMLPEDFVKAGYKKYNSVGSKMADYLLQKRVCDEAGTKYFINCYCYQNINNDKAVAYEIEVFFKKEEYLIAVVGWAFKSVESLEAFYEECWVNMQFEYDDEEAIA